MKSRPAAVLLGLGCVWGTSFVMIKVVVDEISPIELVTARLFFGALVVIGMLAYSKRALPRDPALWAKMGVFAFVANVIPFLLIGYAEKHIESGVASVLNSTMPLFTALFAAAVLMEEEFTTGRLAGLLAGFGGVAVLTGRDAIHVTDSAVLGQLAVVLGAACYAASAVFARTLLRSHDPMPLTALQLALGSLIAATLMFSFEGAPAYGSMSAKAWASVLVLGLIASGVAQWVYLWLVDNMGSVRASLVTYIIPIVGLLLGWAVLDETVSISTIAGFGLILTGVALVMRGEGPSSERLAEPVPAGAGD
jgi:drug/metabolite transporter (DMT)-like permease